jgi:hypothetical protein
MLVVEFGIPVCYMASTITLDLKPTEKIYMTYPVVGQFGVL